ncbi:MAG: hypothetical protein FWD03_05305 [Defluviitaleaceae bacterium]|nr:hypothetical protein [Defluviitaleaceae bacterium]
MNTTYDIYTGALKMLPNFTTPPTYTPNFTYHHTHPKLTALSHTYNLKEKAGNGPQLSQAINLLKWLSDHTFHTSDFDNSIPFNSIDLLKYTYQQPIQKGVNCRALAKILTECCLSIGLKARTLYIMPFSPYDEDNHVVTIVFINDLNKWIMLDPSYNAYFMDENDNILSPWEAREMLSNQGCIRLNDGYNYNGDYTGEKSGEPPEYYIEYMAKDLFWFFCDEISTFGIDANGAEILAVAPIGYDVQKFFVANIEYRIKKYGGSEGLLGWLADVEKTETKYVSFDAFVQKPL